MFDLLDMRHPLSYILAPPPGGSPEVASYFRFPPLLLGLGGRAMAAKLFVGNLSFQATEEDLRELFQQAGTVETVRIITDQFTGRPRGFGFVEMATKEEATKAIEMLNGRLFRDRNLVVDEARPQPQRTGAGGGPRGDRGPRPGGGGGGGGWRR
ncbi:MAG TPA: RNA-binding protein [Candidatus Binatia bacterium]|nr:RNA-binding protein [Candidatus Binatia bacterium]